MFDNPPNLNRKGIESTPFYLILSGIVLLLMASVVFPSYSQWQDTMNLGKTAAEAKEILSSIESVHSLGDVGSIQQTELNLPTGYEIEVRNTGIVIKKGNETLKKYPVDVELIYRGNRSISGPGRYRITVVYWVRNDSTNEGKEFLIEVLDK
ncbi:MAG: hypothetical protein B6U86_00355 [Candidatus Altiarchaeales archaeon ex4484_43]|nr:MAG: hypothetical protein B6U86_00355 [Candidatus Altiarchaeales archaeon ex4484_43]RLI88789.1 MAG: hypothetical protein DRO62_03045 [Candidatus Altiarchaeales archaeon]